MDSDAMDATRALKEAFSSQFEILETHLSYVILTGQYAYKIKKPLNLGFNDYTTIEKRKFYCEKEVLYNTPLAKEIYIGVVPITGSVHQPALEGKGTALEFAVKMHQFPQEGLFSHLIKQKKINENHIFHLAEQVAHFHQEAPIAPQGEPWGTPDFSFMQANFTALRSLDCAKAHQEDIDAIERWARGHFAKIKPCLTQRKTQGFIRACHGDLHLNNIVMQNNQGIIFDCIEFNEGLRWIDVMNEIAFLAMDLDFHQRPDLASLFINRYLEITGDYLGARFIAFYQCYRAMVRAKITALMYQQLPSQAFAEDFTRYLALAKHYTQPDDAELIITFGVSGSGKTLYTQELLKKMPAIRLRSDVLRKQMHSHLANKSNFSAKSPYSPEVTREIYQKLKTLAKALLESKLTVIIDATCLHHWQRQIFVDLAYCLHIHLQLLLFEAPREILERRIYERQAHRKDASDATIEVLALQLASLEPLTESEKEICCLIHYQVIDDLIRSKEN